MNKRTKIVLDSDVVIHFIKGERLPMIHSIFPEFQYVILDLVLDNELRKWDMTRDYLDRYLYYFKGSIEIIEWNPDYEMTKEYATLLNKFDMGESACMIYCKYNQDVVASSNIKDITDYCLANDITWITTMDFLWKAYQMKLLSEEECDDFIKRVVSNGSKLPVKRINDFVPRPLF
jgi:hypothetical protein